MSGIKLNIIEKHVELVDYIKSLIISIEWAPIINVSMKRRYEVFSAFMFIMMVLLGEIFCLYVLYLLLVRLKKFIIIIDVSILLNYFKQFHAGVIGKFLCIAYFTFMLSDIRADETGIRGQG